MTRKEIKTAQNNEVIMELIRSYSSLVLNYNTGGGIDRLERHCADLESELVKRGIITAAQAESLNR